MKRHAIEDSGIGALRRRSWSWLLRNLLLPLGDSVSGQRMMRRLRFLEAAQWWDPERLHRERDLHLQALIRIAYEEVPLYRDLMESARVRPQEIRGADDLGKLPILTKEAIRANYPERTTRPTRRRTYEAATSGSTGSNLRVREDWETAGGYRACSLLALQWAGWRIGEAHLQTGMNLQRSRYLRLKDGLLHCHYISASDLSDTRLDACLELMERYRIRHLWGYPGSLYLLARRAYEQGWNRPLVAAVTWGDTLYAGYRRTIEQAFGTRVYDTYGCGEGIQVSAQCGHGQTYHVHTLDTIVEYLTDTGEPAAEDEPGSLFLTRLHPGPMPLIRYQVGDLGVRGSQAGCGCGRGFDTMQSIEGRDTDLVVTPSGNRLIVHFFTGILEYFEEIEAFQVVQETPEAILLRVVASPEFSAESARRIEASLRARGAEGLEIQIERVPEIPCTSAGKRRFILSQQGMSEKVTGWQGETLTAT
jgi:phenylacetate-CoA ligase